MTTLLGSETFDELPAAIGDAIRVVVDTVALCVATREARVAELEARAGLPAASRDATSAVSPDGEARWNALQRELERIYLAVTDEVVSSYERLRAERAVQK